MKKTRLLILTAVILMALFVAALPALADSYSKYLNWSFEFDDDGDGQPNAWTLRGDGTIYACTDNKHVVFGDCVVGFIGSDRRAAIFQTFDYNKYGPTDEEGVPLALLQASAAAKDLPAGRVLGGQIYHFDDFDFALYGPMRGGTYNFNYQLFWDGAGNAAKDIYLGGVAPNAITWGWLAKAGSGHAYFDEVAPSPYIPPAP